MEMVYLVTAGFDYEGSSVVACLATHEEALAVAERLKKALPGYTRYDNVEIEQWGVGQILEGRP